MDGIWERLGGTGWQGKKSEYPLGNVRVRPKRLVDTGLGGASGCGEGGASNCMLVSIFS